VGGLVLGGGPCSQEAKGVAVGSVRDGGVDDEGGVGDEGHGFEVKLEVADGGVVEFLGAGAVMADVVVGPPPPDDLAAVDGSPMRSVRPCRRGCGRPPP
jgi:hypothetical protein